MTPMKLLQEKLPHLVHPFSPVYCRLHNHHIILGGLFFVDYLIMMIIGCTTCLFGFTENFYSCTYCIIGKSLIAISLVVFTIIISPDIKSLVKNLKLNKLSHR